MRGVKKDVIKWLIDASDGDYEVKEYKPRRSKDANALLWACLQELAEKLRTDKWEVYLMMLRRYGKYTYICVRPSVVEALKAQWRECEVVGEVDINGQTAVQMLCYFGSSTYDTAEFSRLLDGVISEMKEVGIAPPPDKETQKALERWERETRKDKGLRDTEKGQANSVSQGQ